MTTFFTRLALFATLLTGLSSPAPVRAQALDPTFQPTVLKTPLATGLQQSVNALAVQPDGKVLVAGGFDFVNGSLTGKLQRLNPDGTTDATFNAGGTGANGFLAAVLLQPDGKILVGGGFTTFNGQPRNMVVRLNADGSLDNSFTFGSSASIRQISSLALQPDGKILVGSSTSFVPTLPIGGLVRLNSDGSLDSSFNIGSGIPQSSGMISAVLVQADGNILIGGSFTSFNGQSIAILARLTSTGAIDPTFYTTSVGTTLSTVFALAQQPDGKLLVGGAFSQLGGRAANRIARLLPDGTYDSSFQPGTGPNNTVRALCLEPSGNIIVAGTFTQVNGVSRVRVARLTATGALDPSFATGTGANSLASTLALTPTGQVLLGGSFTQYEGAGYSGLAQLNAVTGRPEAAFNPLIETRGTLDQVVPLPNGQLLISGNFTQFNGPAVPGGAGAIRRLNADGSLDGSFTTTAAGTIQAVQPNGNFYVLSMFGGVPALYRYLPNGTLDNTFTAQTFGVSASTTGSLLLYGVVGLPNGQLLVHGLFNSYGSRTGLSGLLRLNADGTPDNTFVPASAPARQRVLKVLVQPSGKLVVVADLIIDVTTFLTRLNSNGSADNSFAAITPTSSGPRYSVLMQSDGRLLVSGFFTSFNGQATPYGQTRLTVDGAIDPTYTGLTDYYSPFLVQSDGRLLALRGNTAETALVRLNSDGSLDTGFSPTATPLALFSGDDMMSGMVLQPLDDKILLYGSFRYVAGQPRIGLARLANVGVTTTRTTAATQPLGLYPNPARRGVTIRLPAASASRPATLLDLQGRVVRRWAVPARQAEAAVNLDAVPAGVYLVRVQGEAAVYQQRLVVTP